MPTYLHVEEYVPTYLHGEDFGSHLSACTGFWHPPICMYRFLVPTDLHVEDFGSHLSACTDFWYPPICMLRFLVPTYLHVEDGDHGQWDEEVDHGGRGHQVQGGLARYTACVV